MKITDVLVGEIDIPLALTFKTSLRMAKSINNVVVKIITDTGYVGYGEAAPTAVITGETKSSIACAVKKFIGPSIIGMDISNFEEIMQNINNCMIGNTSAKASVDIAIYDLYAKNYNTPLYKILGGYVNKVSTDITISLNDVDKMVSDSINAVNRGQDILKVKVGSGDSKDVERIHSIRKAVGDNAIIRVDANQGWTAKESVRIIRCIEDMGLNIELVEQPVKAHDVDGLKFVTDNVLTPILADESVFSPSDAINIIEKRAADLINIKFMKTGGIYNALKICAIAESYGVECMMGCMLEGQISVSAAAHLACAKSIITMVDLDGPNLCHKPAFLGGPDFENKQIIMNEEHGIGNFDLERIEFI